MSKILIAALCALAACSGSSSPGGNDLSMSGPVMSMIGAAGGTVLASDGSGVSIPANALGQTTTITVTAAPTAPAPANTTVVGPAYTFGPEGQQFTSPVTVTLAFDAAKLPSGKTASSVVILTAPAGGSSYTSLTTTVVDASHVSAPSSHFSIFVTGVPMQNTACTTNFDCVPGMVCVIGSGGGTGTCQ